MSVKFEGTSGLKGTLPSNAFVASERWTICGWSKYNSTFSSSVQALAHFSASLGATGDNTDIRFTANNTARGNEQGGGITGYKLSSGLSPATWYHFGVVHEGAGSRPTFYRNAVNQTSSGGGLIPSFAYADISALFVGSVGGTYYPLDGAVADLAIWSVELSAQDMSDLYNKVKTPADIPTGLVGYWQLFNDATEEVSSNDLIIDTALPGTPVYDTNDHPVDISIPPVFIDPSPVDIKSEQNINVEASTWFSSATPMTFSDAVLPTGLSMDINGTITGIVTAGQAGPYTGSVTASNGIPPATIGEFTGTITDWEIKFTGNKSLQKPDGVYYDSTADGADVSITAFKGTIDTALTTPEDFTPVVVTNGVASIAVLDADPRTVFVQKIGGPVLGVYEMIPE